MANFEIIALNTSTPQLLAPQAGDGYKATLVWNNVATTFSGMLFDVTNTASAAGSRIMDMQVGGTSVFNVTPSTSNPGLTVTNSSAATLFSVSNTTIIGTRTVQLTPSANTSALTASSYSLSGSNAQSLVDLAGTWNTSGTPTAIKLNVTDTASNAASLLMDLQVSAASTFRFIKNGQLNARGPNNAPTFVIGTNGNTGIGAAAVAGDRLTTWIAGAIREHWDHPQRRMSNDTGFGWAASADPTQTGLDVILSRKAAANLQLGAADAAAPVAQTIGPQSVVAGTSNTAGANFTIRGSQGTGTGAGGNIVFQVAPAGSSGTAQNALVDRLTITTATNTVTLANTTALVWANRAQITAGSGGHIFLLDSAGTDFGRLGFGGSTSSFPALKRNGAVLETRLADDSAYAVHAMEYLSVTDGVTAPGAAAGRARIYVDTADGDLKVVFADGTVKTIVTDT